VSEPVLILDDVRYGYQRDVRVRASCRIESGEVIAVLGANGAGKSTLVKGLLGVCDHLGGRVEWFGADGNGRHARRQVGYVPQRALAASPIPSTVSELVDSGLVASRGVFGRRTAADRDAVKDAIAAVGLSRYAEHRVSSLSGGQQRRALVARGLAGGGSMLILDEPLAGVDATSQLEIADTLGSLIGPGVTLMIVLHDLGPLADLITRTIEIDDGEVVYDGPPQPSHVHAATGDVDHCDPEPRPAGLGALFPNPR
jgi:zinc transport system ATP-binding protein